MTNAQKSELRAIFVNGKDRSRSDKEIAESVGCSVSSVRKYRAVFACPESRKSETSR